MPVATATPERSAGIQPRKRSIAAIVLIALAAVITAAIAFALSDWWPFSEKQVIKNLQEISDSKIEVANFRRTYFPPGCVMEKIVFHHAPNEALPFLTIDKLAVRASYLGMISQRVSLVTAEGVVLSIPTLGTGQEFHSAPSKITADEILTNIAILEFATHEPDKIVRFDIHQAVLRNVGKSTPWKYSVQLHNPEPPGEVTAEGKFGPWIGDNAGDTAVSGEYKFENANLGVYDGIAGTLASTGKFSGKLSHIDISGTADVPDFEVVMGHHPEPMTANFSAYVDATRGDTFLNRVDAGLHRTHVLAKGSIATSPDGKGKTALIEAESSNARIEDLLGLFINANRSPMSGTAAIHAYIQIPPGKDFLQKIKIRGSFGVGPGKFSNASTQKDVDKLSAGATGESKEAKEDPETALANIEGHISVANAVAGFDDLFFEVPGARVHLHGTYNLVNYKIDLRGRMSVDSKLSDTTTGPKALLLKVMDPIFKKKKKGEVIPVKISGTFAHPTFGLDLNDKKRTNKNSFTLH